jgi:hypothetical protein
MHKDSGVLYQHIKSRPETPYNSGLTKMTKIRQNFEV